MTGQKRTKHADVCHLSDLVWHPPSLTSTCLSCGGVVDKDGYLLNEGTQQGTKEVFATGARRDTREGKGRYDLISPVALRRLALTLERGAVHYGDRNWEKGMPICRLLDSAVRHLYQYLDGRNDEDHLGHAMFNVMALCHTDSMIYAGMYPQSLDDRPSKGEVDG